MEFAWWFCWGSRPRRSSAWFERKAATRRSYSSREHGAAKSVIAAAYFNKLAAERGLPDRATYRGANPQAEHSVSALTGLREDGLTVPSAQKPLGDHTSPDVDEGKRT